MARSSLLPAPARVEYRSSDGQPMAETDHQRTPLTYAVEALRYHYRDRTDVYVSGNLFIYYREGDPQAVVAPDVIAAPRLTHRAVAGSRLTVGASAADIYGVALRLDHAGARLKGGCHAH